MTEEVDAGAELVREFNKYVPVSAAFWLKASDDDERHLYIASDGIDDTNFDVAYGEVLRIAGQLRNRYLDPFRVKLIGARDPLAVSAVEVYRRYPALLPTRIRVGKFGGVSVDEVYVYPPPQVATVP